MKTTYLRCLCGKILKMKLTIREGDWTSANEPTWCKRCGRRIWLTFMKKPTNVLDHIITNTTTKEITWKSTK